MPKNYVPDNLSIELVQSYHQFINAIEHTARIIIDIITTNQIVNGSGQITRSQREEFELLVRDGNAIASYLGKIRSGRSLTQNEYNHAIELIWFYND